MSITLTKGNKQTILGLRNDQKEIQKDMKRLRKLIEHGHLNKKEKKQAKNLLSHLLDVNHSLEVRIKNLF